MSDYTVELPMATVKVRGASTVQFNGRDVLFYDADVLLAFYTDAQSVVKDPEVPPSVS
jgi:hypothetical protein